MAATATNFKYKPFDPSKKHLRRKEVMERTFLASSTISKYLKLGIFPAPTQISPSLVVWRECDIDAFMIEQAKRVGSGVVEGVE
ncbi:TPA: AlpA family phage regulatory protein [Salmonella enterica subsp. arizonae]|nr:AlpA family phage regulatory protein [Salmonella enterica subsp. arizonae]